MAGTGGLMRKLTGPGTWSSLSLVSRVMRSPVNVEAIAQLDGPVPLAVAVDGVGEGSVLPSGTSARSLLAQLAPGLLDQPLEGVGRPYAAEALRTARSRRRSPSRIAAMDARVSPLHHLGEARVAIEEPQQLLARSRPRARRARAAR